MRTTPLLAALIGLALPASAQTQVDANTAIQLPSFAPADGKADHETIAMNSQGDCFVTWSSSVYSLTGPDSVIRRVEGAFLRRTGATTWDLYPTVVLGETDPLELPGSTTVFPLGDICRKPDVVRVGDDFVVSWQRIEDGDTANGQLECAYIEVPASGDAVVHLSDPTGIGYTLDSFDPRTAGSMVDLACAPGTSAPIVAFYVARTSVMSLGGGENAYDFDLRAVTFDFPTIGLPPAVNAPNTLDAVKYDDYAPGDPNGGRVLPDAVFDTFGNVVVAFEEFENGERTGSGNPDIATLHVRRYSIDGGGALTELNAQTVAGAASTFAQRRPNIFRSVSNDEISLAWVELELPASSTAFYHYEITYPDGVNDAAFLDFLPVEVPNDVNPQVPVPLQYRNARAVVLAVNPNPGSFLVGYQLSTESKWNLFNNFIGKQPWRPSLDVLEKDPWRGNNRGVVSLATEGKETTTYTRIFLEFVTI